MPTADEHDHLRDQLARRRLLAGKKASMKELIVHAR